MCGPVTVAVGSTALPLVVRDGLVGAADEQRHGGFGAALIRRNVQRREPAGRRKAQSAKSATDDVAGRADGGRAHPCKLLFLVFRSARAATSLATIA